MSHDIETKTEPALPDPREEPAPGLPEEPAPSAPKKSSARRRTTKAAPDALPPDKAADPIAAMVLESSVAVDGADGELSDEHIPVAPVTPESIEGLPLFEQFLAVWGTPARGKDLWDIWYRMQPDAGRSILDLLAQQNASEQEISLDEAQRRMAVEKFVMDRGGEPFVAEFITQWRARQLAARRPLQPMAIGRKKKR